MPQKFRQRGKKKKAGDKQQQQYEADAAGPSYSRRDRDGDDGDTYTRKSRTSIRQREGFGNSNLIPLGGGGGDAGDVEDLSYPQEGEPVEGNAPPAHIPVDLGGNLEAEASAHDLDVAPFGFVPAELKAYLKDASTNLAHLDADLRRGRYEYEGEEDNGEEEGDGEEGQADLLRQAMLREVSGQELTVATDGECSVALETIIDGLKGRRVRILADRASGSCATLAKHRFGSHVLQAILRGLQRDLVRSTKGKARQASDDETGVLRSSEQLILDFSAELVPQSTTLLQDTFGTHVVRTMLQLLAGQDVVTGSRSKKSAAFRSKAQAAAEGEEGSSTTASKPALAEPLKIKVPASFATALESLRRACVPLDVTGRNEARALLVSPSASPTFALLLSLEAAARESAKPGSLADVVLEGLISAEAGKPESEGEGEATAESSDGVETLLRHPSGSHSLEAILSRLPSRYVDRFWSIYIRGKVSRLACHPVGNFVQASAVRRLGRPLVQEALEEIKVDEGGKMVKEAKTGVLLALMERAAVLSSDEETTLEALALNAVLATFGFGQNAKTDEAEAGLALKAILSLKSKDGWQKMMRRRAEKAAKQAASATAATVEGQADQEDGSRKKRKRADEEEEEEGKLRQEEATVQGSVLLQALVRLREPHNGIVYKGLSSFPSPLPYASNPIASHIYLTSLSSPTSSFVQRRRLLLSLLPHLPALADDKYASRLSDAVWDRADGFMREKIVREVLLERGEAVKARLKAEAEAQAEAGATTGAANGGSGGTGKRIPTETFLSGSFYGRFFLRRVGLAMYRKDIWKWKDWAKALPAVPLADRLGSGSDDAVQEVEDGEDDVDTTEGVGERNGAKKSKKEKKKRKERTKEEKELDNILAGV
ncbi:hypothetical protein BCV69DRAFT_315058 [Microstroma glucosiphilum]|uniref:Nucleolar protein 9 n=1 Tax=Pseudomicrostroma glucosiphilum TaxID=1684307 RepID=A0A316U4Q8_9BASI|nr:hypothetical protein BCV69DRAFT_315058 [Pseudomicrostroma glucosiphilum]PWN17935.1 hypothetical protein BCV69DRAFT_315058 [Pseudomicrostroma glucosiphilum]